MKIIWSPQAEQNLYRIALLMARDKKEAAFRWVDTVEKKVRRLALFPKSGRVVPELGSEEIREIIAGQNEEKDFPGFLVNTACCQNGTCNFLEMNDVQSGHPS